MRYKEIREQLIEILQDANGRFLSAYQICQRIEEKHADVWQSLVNDYPSIDTSTPMGEGTGSQYSPASFVANALKYFSKKLKITGLRQEHFDCEGVSFRGIDPGFTGNVVGIWAINS